MGTQLNSRTTGNGPVAHVRFAGRSFDISLSAMDLGVLSADGQIRRAIARYLDVPEHKLDAYVVDRHPNGNVTLRPEAVFGSGTPARFMRSGKPQPRLAAAW
jgi:hypothetical protein